MSQVSRFGVSLDSDLLTQFDAWIAKKGIANRSQAVGQLVRETLAQEDWRQQGKDVVGTLTLVYDHEHRILNRTLTTTQHTHHHEIVCSQHVHLDEANCLEVIVLRGSARAVQHAADHLSSLKGVKHAHFVGTSSGKVSIHKQKGIPHAHS
ncbi:MAG: nickel-responsive transcriptional regulator NikR [Candidatus Omnitrophica bacterium]|nr:nickel-responsive transcriptional regulator NikR [Candidatus Omnitrophota bacterium]